MDPYLTARSFSTPLTLLASGFTVQACSRAPRSAQYAAAAVLSLLLAAAMHPLMAGYGALLCALIAAFALARRRATVYLLTLIAALLLAETVHRFAAPCGVACTLAAHSREYWFPSQWRWFEWIGLAAPLLFFWALTASARAARLRPLLDAGLCLGIVATTVALIFCRWDANSFALARLQPLRVFLPLYLAFLTILPATAAEWLPRSWRASRISLFASAIALFSLLFALSAFLQQRTYPASRHLELPALTPRNRWVQAFLWLRQNTPADSLVALDANYTTLPGEDAQNVRAWSRRSTLPDFAKDGGAAADDGLLAPAWRAAVAAQTDLNALSDAQRLTRLAPWHVDWLVLTTAARTAFGCPYRNSVVKLCRLPRPPAAQQSATFTSSKPSPEPR